MAIIFKYENVPRPDGTLRRAPYIPVWVQTKSGRAMRVVALIDSGADDTVIPCDLAALLGIHPKGEVFDTGGIGGSVKVRRATLDFTIKGDHETYPLRVTALVLQDENVDVPIILGRNSFFEAFHITFKQNERKLVLKKVKPKS